MLFLAPALLIDVPVYAGSNFTVLSQVTNVIKIRNAQEMEKIVEQLIAARAASQKALSQEEIARIGKEAQEAKANQEALIVDSGAMVFCGSVVVE